MSTKGVADVVFCIDASQSMAPCFDALRKHIGKFVEGLKADANTSWDLRLDFLAHAASNSRQGILFRQSSLYHANAVDGLYARSQSGRFFTANIAEFCNGLSAVETQGDEATLIALDSSLDFPFRPASTCHRVVVLLTDEPLETGLLIPEQREQIAAIIEKIQSLRVMLFMVGPESPGFDKIAAADRSEYDVIGTQNRGLTDVDFAKVLSGIGRSVSVSSVQGQDATIRVRRALFGQDRWGAGYGTLTGA